MQGPKQDEIQKDSVLRVLDFGAVWVHNNHIQSGFKTARACAMCTKGLDGAYAPFESAKPVGEPVAVSTGDGDDKAGDPPSAPDYGDYTAGQTD